MAALPLKRQRTTDILLQNLVYTITPDSPPGDALTVRRSSRLDRLLYYYATDSFSPSAHSSPGGDHGHNHDGERERHLARRVGESGVGLCVVLHHCVSETFVPNRGIQRHAPRSIQGLRGSPFFSAVRQFHWAVACLAYSHATTAKILPIQWLALIRTGGLVWMVSEALPTCPCPSFSSSFRRAKEQAPLSHSGVPTPRPPRV